jgi:hypothetical protein
MLLMSTVSGAAHHSEAKAAPTALVQLKGTFPLKIQKSPVGAGLMPATSGLVGTGNVGKFGRTVVVLLEGDSSADSETVLAVTNKQGYVALASDISLPGKGARTFARYEIIDAADGPLYSHIKITGTVTISDVVAKGGKSSFVLKLS